MSKEEEIRILQEEFKNIEAMMHTLNPVKYQSESSIERQALTRGGTHEQEEDIRLEGRKYAIEPRN